jgi:hypothetical protein
MSFSAFAARVLPLPHTEVTAKKTIKVGDIIKATYKRNGSVYFAKVSQIEHDGITKQYWGHYNADFYDPKHRGGGVVNTDQFIIEKVNVSANNL